MKGFLLLTGVFLVFLLLSSWIPDVASDYHIAANANILVPQDYPSIQQAINHAQPNDTVFVSTGTYYERIVINKTIVLIGENRENTIVDGNNGGSVVQIVADNVTITGFKVQNSGYGWGKAGIGVYGVNKIRILDNSLFHTCHQIRVVGSQNSIVAGNILTAETQFFPSVYGIRLENSSNCLVEGNSISNHIGGLHLENATSNTVSGNYVFQNDQGIRLYTPATDNMIVSNTIFNNTYDGMIVPMPLNQTLSDNIFYHNNFVNNSKPFIQRATGVIWDNGQEGNHWTRYNGKDQDQDGIGDTPYDVEQEQDHFPLMGVFSSFNTTLDSEVYVISNSTIENFQFFKSNNSITILVSKSSMAQAYGFCRIRLPHILIDEPYTVIINGANPIYSNYSLHDDGRNRWIYFAYEHSSLEIVLIPEFPSSITLILFVGLILLVVFVYRRKNWHLHAKCTTR